MSEQDMMRKLVTQVEDLADQRIALNARIRELEIERDRLREALDEIEAKPHRAEEVVARYRVSLGTRPK